MKVGQGQQTTLVLRRRCYGVRLLNVFTKALNLGEIELNAVGRHTLAMFNEA